MSKLDDLFRQITGYEVPDEDVAAPTSSIDLINDLEPGFVPDPPDMHDHIDTIHDVVDGVLNHFSESGSEMRRLATILETPRIPSGMVRAANGVSYDPNVNAAYKTLFNSNMVWVKEAFARHNISRLYNCPYIAFLDRVIDTDGTWCGYYTVDRMYISARAANRGTHTPANNGYKGTIVHEYAHRFHFLQWDSIPTGQTRSLNQHISAFYNYANQHPAIFVSQYARTNHKEFWAEAFRRYIRSANGLSSRPATGQWVKEVLDAYGGRFR